MNLFVLAVGSVEASGVNVINCSLHQILFVQWRSVEKLGATVVLVGDYYDEAQAYAKKRGETEGRTFIPPFDHPDVIVGQGTIGMEIVRHMPSPLHAIFVPVGGGGLIAGIAAYVKRVSPEVCFLFVVELNFMFFFHWINVLGIGSLLLFFLTVHLDHTHELKRFVREVLV